MKLTEIDRPLLVERFPPLAEIEDPVWIAGGAIRDLVLDRTVTDVDVVVGSERTAKRLAKAVGDRVVELGREIATWRAVVNSEVYDFAPLQGKTIELDLGRRDFTINAMAVGLLDGAASDLFGGETDCRDGLVRMVEETNLEDDPLRALRAVRFAAVLRFRIDDATAEACSRHASGLTDVAAERISYELRRTLSEGDFTVAVRALRRTGVAKALGLVLPESLVPNGTPAANLAAWLLQLDAADRERLGALVNPGRSTLAVAAPAVILVEEIEAGAGLERIWRAGENVAGTALESARHLGLDRSSKLLGGAVASKGFFRTKPLLDGSEIQKAAGIGPGPLVGELSSRLMEQVLEGRVRTREDAVRSVTEMTEDLK